MEFSLNGVELQLIYTSVELLREDVRAAIDGGDLLPDNHNRMLDEIKVCNSVLRKIKGFAKENGQQIIPFDKL